MKPTFLSLSAVLLAAAFAPGALAQKGQPGLPTPDRRNAVTEAVRKARAGVVTIQADRYGRAKSATGTGIIVDERGYLVTNFHVVGGQKAVSARLFDGPEVEGTVVSGDAGTDLAVVRIVTDKKLSALVLAPAGDLMVGETVIAVGHPYGYTNT